MAKKPAPPGFTPNRLLNYLHEKLGTDSEKALCVKLGMHKASLNRAANSKEPFGSQAMIAMLDAVPDLTLAQLRKLAGMPREAK